MKIDDNDRRFNTANSHFVPSILPGVPDEEDEDRDLLLPPPKLTFQQKLAQLYQRFRLKDWMRRETRKAIKKRQEEHNPPGTKLVRRWYKAKHGLRGSATEAWSWFNTRNPAEPELRAGASRFERKRHEQRKTGKTSQAPA